MPPVPRVAFVTGASSGIGRATALLLARQGDRVACVSRTQDALDALVAEIRRGGGEAIALRADVLKQDEIERAVSDCARELGGLDVLVPSAGIIAPGTLEATSLEAFDSMMTINLRSVVHLLKVAIPYLEKRPGCVVALSSVAGFRSFPGVFSYCVSKAALEQAVRCAALDLGPKGIRVNAVAPGVVVTELHRRGGMDEAAYKAFLERSKTTHPLGRVGEAQEVAEAIAFLASDRASWLTGVLLPVDGGRGITCLR
jgi:NAD(P)-dependent dehydrogenase (short-subunit alcohol dehydrogenase family)